MVLWKKNCAHHTAYKNEGKPNVYFERYIYVYSNSIPRAGGGVIYFRKQLYFISHFGMFDLFASLYKKSVLHNLQKGSLKQYRLKRTNVM